MNGRNLDGGADRQPPLPHCRATRPGPMSQRRGQVLNRKLRRALPPALLIVALAVVAAATAVAAGARPAAKNPGPLAALIKQSKKESGLVFYGNPPTANFNALIERFHY